MIDKSDREPKNSVAAVGDNALCRSKTTDLNYFGVENRSRVTLLYKYVSTVSFKCHITKELGVQALSSLQLSSGNGNFVRSILCFDTRTVWTDVASMTFPAKNWTTFSMLAWRCCFDDQWTSYSCAATDRWSTITRFSLAKLIFPTSSKST